jgi:signal transduction histidine kinase
MTTKDRGSGLGLAIVKKIAEEHNGSVWAGNHKDGGATLTLRLPVAEPVSTTLPRERSA